MSTTTTNDLAAAGLIFDDAVNLSIGGVTQANQAQYEADLAQVDADITSAIANGAIIDGATVSPTNAATLSTVQAQLVAMEQDAPLGTGTAPVASAQNALHSDTLAILNEINRDSALGSSLSNLANANGGPEAFLPLSTEAADDAGALAAAQSGDLAKMGTVFNAAADLSIGGLNATNIAEFDADMHAVASGLTNLLNNPTALSALETGEVPGAAALTTAHLQTMLSDINMQIGTDALYATDPNTAAAQTNAQLQHVISIVQHDPRLTEGPAGYFGELPPAGNTVDTTAPVVTEALGNDTGTLSNDHVTKDSTLTGSGDANAVVSFTIDGTPIATTATADGSGNWTFTPTGLSDGQHTAVASETDAAGNTGTASLTFMLDTTLPAVTEALKNDTGTLSNDHVTKDSTLTGSGDANAVVSFTVDGKPISTTVTADGNGSWVFAPTGLSDGQHTVIASETDAAGNTGTASLNFMLDTTPPIDQITSDTLNKNNSFTISGTSEKGAAVKIFDGASLLGSTVPDANGHWVFTTQSLSSTSVHTFTSTATDVAGNVASTGAAIYGTASKDAIYSTSANDILTGGRGADTFVFSKAAFGKDTITDFASTGAGHDVLQIDHSIFATDTAALAHATQVGSNVVVAYDAADTITLVGVNLHQLSANDFHII